MPYDSSAPNPRAAAHCARANVVLYSLATCVFGVSGLAAAFFGNVGLAVIFWTTAGILTILAIKAAAKVRRDHPSFPTGRIETRRQNNASS